MSFFSLYLLLLPLLLFVPIAFVVWPLLLLSLAMSLLLPFLRQRLGVLPLFSHIFIYVMFNFLRVLGFRWVRWLLRVLWFDVFWFVGSFLL